MFTFKPIFQIFEYNCELCGYQTNSIFKSMKHMLIKKPDISDKQVNTGKTITVIYRKHYK